MGTARFDFTGDTVVVTGTARVRASGPRGRPSRPDAAVRGAEKILPDDLPDDLPDVSLYLSKNVVARDPARVKGTPKSGTNPCDPVDVHGVSSR